jgi:bifunctional enzyme CysN/CysC
MAVAASRADVALVLVDASRGIRTQTLRHITICSLMGVNRIAVVVNKLDAAGYSEEIYQGIVNELAEVAKRLGISDYQAIPVSALAGDNVVVKSSNMPWYKGPTLLEYIQSWNKKVELLVKPHLGVQLIARAENFRGLSGTIFNGTFTKGDEVVVREKSHNLIQIKAAIEASKRREIPQWIEMSPADYRAKVRDLPARDDITAPIEERLIVELYSK